MQIYAIVNGTVLPYVLDPNLNKYLPIIPAEVGYVNFTWKAGLNNYRYSFDNLQSFDEAILKPPVISIKTKGRIPKKPKEFSVLLPCSGNISGLAAFSISLEIKRKGGKVLDGTPLKLKLRKECAQRGKFFFRENSFQNRFFNFNLRKHTNLFFSGLFRLLFRIFRRIIT